MITKISETLKKFPVITKGQAEEIQYGARMNKGTRQTIESNGVFYDIRKMTDEEADKVWEELTIK